MSIRPPTSKDLDGLVELCAEHAAFERAPFTRDGQVERLEEAIFGRDPRLFVRVLALEGTLQGFAAASLEYSTWRARSYLHLDCLFVRDGLRGSGWGSRLLAAIVERARDLGCEELQWQTPPWNEKAIAFYDAQGATAKPKLRFTLPLSL